MTGCLRLLPLLCLTAGLIAAPKCADAAPAAMKGPPAVHSAPPADEAATFGPMTGPLLGAIRFFQDYVSPVDGVRCQFAPTCSVFGHRAVRAHGPGLGLLMTADRLMRCSYWTDPADYPRLPNGKPFDPVPAMPGGR